MRIAIPIGYKSWYEEGNPTDGEVLFIAAVAIFARLIGVKTYQQWHTQDIRSIIRPQAKGQVPGKILARDLAAQGVLEYMKDIDGVETIRLDQHSGITEYNLFTNVFEVKITDVNCIMAFSFFLGRVQDLYDVSEIKELKVVPKLKSNGKPSKTNVPTKIVLPNVYTQQLRYFEETYGEA
jgi:hypothetical protein